MKFLCRILFDEREEGLLEAVLLAQAAGFGALFCAALSRAAAAQHQVFRRVGKVDELDDVHIVALVLQNGGADGVGQQRRETLLKKPVGKRRSKSPPLRMVLLTSCWQQGTEKMCSTPREMA